MARIIPTVFAHNKREFMQRLQRLLPTAKHFQVDFMDGKFVKGKSVMAGWLPNLKKYERSHNVTFEAHLMVKNPGRWITRIKKKGFTRIIFHIETTTEPQARRLINRIKKAGMSSTIAINPATSIERLYPFINLVDGFLFMGIHPGKEHQKLLPNVYNKIRSFKRHYAKARVQIDGGVNHTTAMRLALAGADALNSGSYVAAALDPSAAKRSLEKAFRKGLKGKMVRS